MNRLTLWLLLAVALTTAHRFPNEMVLGDRQILEPVAALVAEGGLGRAFTGSTRSLIDQEDEVRSVDFYRPVALLSLAFDHMIGGGSLIPFHATNLALHLLCVWLVVLLARGLLPEARRRWAPLAGALFGFSPFLTEAHVWIGGRFDVLMTAFGLAALLAWRRGVADASQPPRWEVAAAGLFLAGLLCKATLLFTWPALLLWPRAHHEDRWARAHSLKGFAAASAAYFGLRAAVLPSGGSTVHADHLLDALVHLPTLLLDGLRSLVLPGRLYLRAPYEDYGALDAESLAMGAIVVLVVAVMLVRHRRRMPLAAWSALWFVACLAPFALITTQLWLGFGRYLYLPAAMLCIGLTDLVARLYEAPRLAGSHRMLRAGLVAYLVMMGARSHIWVYQWRNEITFYESIVAAAPQQSHGFGMLGAAFMERQEVRLGAAWLKQALKRAPEERRYMLLLSEALVRSGRVRKGRAVAERGIDLHPPALRFRLLAGYATMDADPPAGQRHLRDCLDIEPAHSGCRHALALLEERHPELGPPRAVP